MRIHPHPPSWAELVFHVLAHVPAPGVPACLHSPWYVAWAERMLGPASARALGQDLPVLGTLLREHRTLVAVQGLCWLWRDTAQALSCSARTLSELRGTDVAEPALLDALRPHAAALELLRCAALLEAEAFASLPAPTYDQSALQAAVSALVPHAPALADAQLTPTRPLTCHGRVRGAAIWIGVPGAGVTLEQLALQAAHEASVREVLARKVEHAERRVEAIALVLSNERIAGSRYVEAHGAWCRAHRVRADDLDPERLSPRERACLDACLRG